MKKNLLLLTSLLSLALVGCGDNPFNSNIDKPNNNDTNTSLPEANTSEPSNISHAENISNYVSEIISDFTITSTVADGYSINNNIYTISKAGEYTLSGNLPEGQVYVDAGSSAEVKLILNGTSISSSTNSPIYINDGDKVTISSEEGSYNKIEDKRALKTVDDDTQGGGAIYSTCDLNISGKGALEVVTSYNNGIHTKDDLKIKNVVLNVTAPNNALKGNDSLTVESGNLTLISTGGDGMKTDNSDISSKGNQRGTISLKGGNIDIYAACDAIDASYDVVVENGVNLNAYTGKYSTYSGEIVSSSTTKMYIKMSASYASNCRYAAMFYNSEDDYTWVNSTKITSSSQFYTYYELDRPSNYTNVAFFKFNNSQTENSTTDYTACTEGGTINSSRDLYIIKSISGTNITGSWSTYTQTSSNQGPGGMNQGGNNNKTDYSCKGIKSDNVITINGGTINIKANDDAIHANRDVVLENGSNGVGSVNINGGDIYIVSVDDGIHADYDLIINDGNINITNAYEGIEGNYIEFNGGNTKVYATDDGVNAAGSYKSIEIKVTGGYLDVTVPSGDVDGIDSNGNYTQTGGFVITRDGTTMTGGMASGFDIDGTCLITGGTFICAGPIGQTPNSSSTNQWVKFASGGSSSTSRPGGFGGPGGGMGGNSGTGLSFTAGTYTISNTDIEFTLSSSYSGLWISSDKLTKDGSYTISNGTTSYSWTQSSNPTTVSK